MSLTIEIDHPDFEKDVEFDVAGILVKNGSKTELTEDQERLLVARRQQPAREVLEGAAYAKVSGSSVLSKKDLEGIIVESNFGPVPEVEVEETTTTEESQGSDN